MDQTELLVKSIIEGLQEKKGKNIVTVDLNQTTGAICQYMVICEGNTPTQVAALSDSVWDFAHKKAKEKPLSIDGQHGARWIGMDYGTVLEIEDHGIGIPQEELKHIQQPFFRASNARGYAGHGIGLSLSLKILQAYGAKIVVTSEVGVGTKFQIDFYPKEC